MDGTSIGPVKVDVIIEVLLVWVKRTDWLHIDEVNILKKVIVYNGYKSPMTKGASLFRNANMRTMRSCLQTSKIIGVFSGSQGIDVEMGGIKVYSCMGRVDMLETSCCYARPIWINLDAVGILMLRLIGCEPVGSSYLNIYSALLCSCV